MLITFYALNIFACLVIIISHFIMQFRHGLVEDLLIGLITQVGDKSALFCP